MNWKAFLVTLFAVGGVILLLAGMVNGAGGSSLVAAVCLTLGTICGALAVGIAEKKR